MKRVIKLAFAFVVLILIVRVVIGGDEDTWICKEGAWIKHGNPAAPTPSAECITKIVK